MRESALDNALRIWSAPSQGLKKKTPQSILAPPVPGSECNYARGPDVSATDPCKKHVTSMPGRVCIYRMHGGLGSGWIERRQSADSLARELRPALGAATLVSRRKYVGSRAQEHRPALGAATLVSRRKSVGSLARAHRPALGVATLGSPRQSVDSLARAHRPALGADGSSQRLKVMVYA